MHTLPHGFVSALHTAVSLVSRTVSDTLEVIWNYLLSESVNPQYYISWNFVATSCPASLPLTVWVFFLNLILVVLKFWDLSQSPGVRVKQANGRTHRLSDLVGLGWDRKFSSLTVSPILLLMLFQSPHFEKYCSNLTYHFLVSNYPGCPLPLKLKFKFFGLLDRPSWSGPLLPGLALTTLVKSLLFQLFWAQHFS